MRKWITAAVLTTVALATMACGAASNAAQEDSASGTVSAGVTQASSATNNGSTESSSGREAAEVVRILPDDLEWQDNPEIEGVENASGVGNLQEEGLYAAFGRMSEGAVFPAHTHTDDRLTTVISGTMYYGIGEEFDEDNMTAYPAGSVIFTPAGTPHVMWVQEGQAVIQESGDGPSGTEFLEDQSE